MMPMAKPMAAAATIVATPAAIGSGGGSGNRVARTTVVRSATSAKDTILAWVQQTVNHYQVS